ncbi:hypothetical protein IQ255_08090 [Pleurocapsales cyanobacterium LEGE 10410]|nr:hypothetical protein [Pleurocapsales cyanobacterium LEGE 10410]
MTANWIIKLLIIFILLWQKLQARYSFNHINLATSILLDPIYNSDRLVESILLI